MSKELYNLIHSLSPSEKRYFRIWANRQVKGEQNHYLFLFDSYLNAKSYDALLMKEAPVVPAAKNRQAVEKNYLKSQIFRAMRAYNEEKDLDNRLGGMMTDLHFLFRKKLFAQFAKELRRLRKLATTFERYPLLIELASLERRFHWENNSHSKEEMDELLGSLRKNQDRWFNQAAYTELFNRMYALARHKHQLTDEKRHATALRIMDHPLLADSEAALTWHSRLYFFHIHAIYQQLRGNWGDAARYYRRVIETWEENPRMIAEAPFRYRRSLSNLLSIQHLNEDYGGFLQNLEKIRNSPTPHLADKVEVFDFSYHLELHYALGQHDFERATNLVPGIENGLRLYQEHLPANRLLSFYANLGLLFLLCENFFSALQWVQRLLNSGLPKARQDLWSLAECLELILHYELGHWDLLEYRLRAAGRQNDIPHRLYLLKALLHRLMESPPAEQQGAFKEAVGQWHVQLTDQEPGNQEIKLWLQSRAEQKPILSFLP